MLEIPLPSIETREGWFSVRIYKPQELARVQWSPVGRHLLQQEWSPCPVLWRLQRTFRGDATDMLAGVRLNITQIENWIRQCNVFPGFGGGKVYTFTLPFWWAMPHAEMWRSVDNFPSPANDLAHSMLELAPLVDVLDRRLREQPSMRSLNHDLRELTRWAQANNPDMSVLLDGWFTKTGFQLQGLNAPQDGGTFDAWHGTRTEFKTLRPSTGGEFGPGIYLASTEGMANFYARSVAAGPLAPTVLKLRVTFRNPFVVQKIDWIRMTERSTPSSVVKRLRAKGHDGIIGIGINGVDRQYVAWDAAQITG